MEAVVYIFEVQPHVVIEETPFLRVLNCLYHRMSHSNIILLGIYIQPGSRGIDTDGSFAYSKYSNWGGRLLGKKPFYISHPCHYK